MVLPADTREAAVCAGRPLTPFSCKEPVQRLRRWRLPSREGRGGKVYRVRSGDRARRTRKGQPRRPRELTLESAAEPCWARAGGPGYPARPASQENRGASGDPLISDPRRALPEWGPPGTRETTVGPRTTAVDKSGARAADRAPRWLRAGPVGSAAGVPHPAHRPGRTRWRASRPGGGAEPPAGESA